MLFKLEKTHMPQVTSSQQASKELEYWGFYIFQYMTNNRDFFIKKLYAECLDFTTASS